ncbi:MAG: diaminopropionate ammonia-lyase [Pseudomonadota bacterium]
MKIEFTDPDGRPSSLVRNDQASRAAAWTPGQDSILNDNALTTARDTITSWQGYAPTPLFDLSGLAGEIGVAAIHYKDEGGRFGLGSFKALGGAYAVARLLAKQIGCPLSEIVAGEHADAVGRVTVCCATDGNHGRSVAWGAQRFGCRCVIFIHATVSEGRKTAIEAFAAEVRRCDGNYDDSVREAQETASREGWFVVSDTSYPGYMEIPRDVMQGYEVMASEAFDALERPPTHMFLQTGVGGMAAAIVACAKRRWGDDRPMVVLTDPDQSACWVDTYVSGEPTPVHGDLDTLMAGLACGEISALAWEILQDHGDAAMAVSDASAIEMMRRLACPPAPDAHIVAGESAVAGLAGLAAAMHSDEMRAALSLDDTSRVLVFGTEGDTDPELYTELVGATGSEIRGH